MIEIKLIEQEGDLQRYKDRLLIALELKKPYCAMEAIENALIHTVDRFSFDQKPAASPRCEEFAAVSKIF